MIINETICKLKKNVECIKRLNKALTTNYFICTICTDVEILQEFFETYEKIFKFKEVHPNERITIERQNDYIYFVLESRITYKIGVCANHNIYVHIYTLLTKLPVIE